MNICIRQRQTSFPMIFKQTRRHWPPRRDKTRLSTFTRPFPNILCLVHRGFISRPAFIYVAINCQCCFSFPDGKRNEKRGEKKGNKTQSEHVSGNIWPLGNIPKLFVDICNKFTRILRSNRECIEYAESLMQLDRRWQTSRLPVPATDITEP